uniref:Extended synaptotagmin 2 n=1 Tax=Echinococcus granulosus TaxID=6210 RepID=A0A068W7J1_ECHGR|nr:extended synaptotagmin 2 [Echinococcus granulosus]
MDKSLDKPQNEKTGVKFDILSTARTYIKLISCWVAIWGLGYYKFSPSWVAFGAIGYMAYSRAYEKRNLVSSVMRTITEDEKASVIKNIGSHELPAWVYFPDIERAEWLNKVVQRMWPYISEYVNKVLVVTVQPAVNANLPSSLQPFLFLRTDLGDAPPRIGGIKVYVEESIQRDEVVMDVDLMLYSDARIKVSVGKIVAGVKDFELRGTLRISLKPLVSQIPFVGAVTVCFLDNPYINFLLTHMGNILTMPGVQQTLYRTVQDTVSSLCVLPNRISVPLVNNVILEQIRFPSAQGAIRVEVISASDLVSADVNLVGQSSSDPYCVVRVGAEKFVTKVISRTLSPTWNECFEAIVDQRMGQSVIIEVWDKDASSKDDELGLTTIPIEEVYLRGQINSVKMLEGVKKGKVHMKVTWLDLSPNASDFVAVEQARRASSAEKAIFNSYLFVRVEQGRNLMRLRFLQEPSPYCVLQIGNVVQNTVVREKTQNPIWESPHHFLFSNPDIQTLNIEIRDSKLEVVLGTLAIPLKHLKAEKNMTVTQPYVLQAAGPDNATLYLHLELRALVPGPDRRPHQDREPMDSRGSEEASAPSSPLATAFGNSRESLAKPSPDRHSPPSPQTENVVRHRNGGSKSSGEEDHVLVAPPNPAGRVRLTMRYDADMEILEVTVDRAENILGVDKDGLSDPYVKLSVIDSSGHTVGESKKTRAVKNDLNPIFEQSFEFSVKSEVMETCKLWVDVKNHVGPLQRNTHIRNLGSVLVSLRELKCDNGFTEWYWLHRSLD